MSLGILALFFGVTFNTAAIVTLIGAIAGLLTAISTFLALKNSRMQAQASETTAEATAIKTIAEANTVAIKNMQQEIERLIAGEERFRRQYDELTRSHHELQEAFTRVTQRLNQERKWTVRLIRALTQAGLEIPARPEVTEDDPIDTDETIALGTRD